MTSKVNREISKCMVWPCLRLEKVKVGIEFGERLVFRSGALYSSARVQLPTGQSGQKAAKAPQMRATSTEFVKGSAVALSRSKVLGVSGHKSICKQKM